MSMINKEVSDFKVQAYQNGEFRTVMKADILGKWSIFFFVAFTGKSKATICPVS